MKRHILAIVTEAFGGRGGIAQYNRDLLATLASAGYVITVVPRHAGDCIETPAGIEQWMARSGRIRFSLACLLAALNGQVDIVFCGHVYMAPLAWLVAWLARAKLVIQTHGIEAWQRPGRLSMSVVESADVVLCVSRHTRARVLSWAAITPERVIVVPNTVNECFCPGDEEGLRQEWGLQGKRVVLMVARMDRRERYKGHDRVISAIPNLVARGHDVIYLVVGDGDDRPFIEAFALDQQVLDRVKFLGALSTEKLISVYRMADLFVMPSTGEGFGIAFLEAMASGIPALGLAVAGACDALADGELGLLATESDFPKALTRALEEPPPDAQFLAAATKRRFGHEQFRLDVEHAFGRLWTDLRVDDPVLIQ